eukprot:bmy_13229T0
MLTTDKCKHIGQLRLVQDHSILNPQKWHCVDCNTTELICACVSSSCVVCGRYTEEPALKHFQESSHPVALELLRSTLSAIKSQNYHCNTGSGSILQSMGTSDDSYFLQDGAHSLLQNVYQMYTALWHRRRILMVTHWMKNARRTISGKNSKKRSEKKTARIRVSNTVYQMNECQEKVTGSVCSRHPSLSSGLSGGASKSRKIELIQPRKPIMWSGKWALVTPFAMLHSVWRLIPDFRDALEIICELLDKTQHELETTDTRIPSLIPTSQRKLIKHFMNVVNNIFHRQLLSQVTCLACDNKSNIIAPFWDLSLEFPKRYQCNGKDTTSQPCLVTKMLAKFTKTEASEGKIYICDQCNSKHRRFSSKPVILTETPKQLMIFHLLQVLRLHLKRFRWSDHNN